MKKALFLLLTIILTSCSPDYQMSESREVEVIVDSYVQAERLGELDVLVALDTSGSMSDNFEEVADGMDILRSDIESLTLDYRFGYITMDPTEIGYIGPFDSTSTAIDMLMAPSLLPNTNLEEGFSATYTFLQSDEGNEFRRPEADFLLFLISDEDEQSAITTDLFYDWLHEEFKDVRHDVACIANPDDENAGWANEAGHKYIELSSLYGKDLLDIKEEDWSAWLSSSSYLTQLKDFITLSNPEPIVDSIIVYIDQEIVYDWRYVEETNTVYLGVAPDYGSVVEVGYNVYAQ